MNRGDRASLVGENGVGKSTLARLILRQEEAERGDIWLMPGAILAATHDRAFIEKVAATIWRLRDGRLIIEPV